MSKKQILKETIKEIRYYIEIAEQDAPIKLASYNDACNTLCRLLYSMKIINIEKFKLLSVIIFNEFGKFSKEA